MIKVLSTKSFFRRTARECFLSWCCYGIAYTSSAFSCQSEIFPNVDPVLLSDEGILALFVSHRMSAVKNELMNFLWISSYFQLCS